MAKQAPNSLVVRVQDLSDEELLISEDLPREWLTNIPEFSDDSGTHIEGLIHLEGRVLKEGENLRVAGRVAAELSTFCTRCGEPLVWPVRGEFEWVLVKGKEPELRRDQELTPEDMVHSYYEGPEVDLSPFFQEEIALQVPIQPLCREECRGLCAHCGANLNQESCRCETEEGDPRLAVLRHLKIER